LENLDIVREDIPSIWFKAVFVIPLFFISSNRPLYDIDIINYSFTKYKDIITNIFNKVKIYYKQNAKSKVLQGGIKNVQLFAVQRASPFAHKKSNSSEVLTPYIKSLKTLVK
jgi:hypothetical protein